jgi:hypothetical protein
MALEVTFEKNGDRILVTTPMSLHWCKVKDTYGIELRQDNDYRNGHRLETRLWLTAFKHHGVLGPGEIRWFAPPPQFPTELHHEFLDSTGFNSRIEDDRFLARVDLVSELDWRLTKDNKHLKLDFVQHRPTSIGTLGLDLHLSLVFRTSEERSRPLEFEWGIPGVYSSHFESNRRRH